MFSLARDLCSSFSLKQFSLNCSCKSDRKDDSIHAVFLFMNAFFRTEHQKLSVSPAPAPLPVTGKGPDKGAPEHWLGHKGTVLPHAGSPEDRTFANAFLPPHSLSWTLCKAFFFLQKKSHCIESGSNTVGSRLSNSANRFFTNRFFFALLRISPISDRFPEVRLLCSLALPQTHVLHLLAAHADKRLGSQGDALLEAPLGLVFLGRQSVGLEMAVAHHLELLSALKAGNIGFTNGILWVDSRCLLGFFRTHGTFQCLGQFTDIGCHLGGSHGADAGLGTSYLQSLLHNICIRHDILLLRHNLLAKSTFIYNHHIITNLSSVLHKYNFFTRFHTSCFFLLKLSYFLLYNVFTFISANNYVMSLINIPVQFSTKDLSVIFF